MRYHIPKGNQIENSHLPLLNPYKAFRRSYSFSSSVKKLVSPKFQVPKEYILSTRFDQCILPSGPQEHFVIIEIPPEFPTQWIQQGYTHIHFGAVRLALNYHGIKGRLVFSRIALLDSRYLKYENACIGIAETSLDPGTVYMTFFPNYNMTLKDPTLLTCLKVQIQIVDAEMIDQTHSATLHYQMAYRVQDHAIDNSIPHKKDIPFIKYDSQSNSTTCVHVPKTISKEEMAALLSTTWVKL